MRIALDCQLRAIIWIALFACRISVASFCPRYLLSVRSFSAAVSVCVRFVYRHNNVKHDNKQQAVCGNVCVLDYLLWNRNKSTNWLLFKARIVTNGWFVWCDVSMQCATVHDTVASWCSSIIFCLLALSLSLCRVCLFCSKSEFAHEFCVTVVTATQS